MIQSAAHVFADAVNAQIEMEGMKAVNAILESRGLEFKYGEDSFNHLRDRMRNSIAEHYRR